MPARNLVARDPARDLFGDPIDTALVRLLLPRALELTSMVILVGAVLLLLLILFSLLLLVWD